MQGTGLEFTPIYFIVVMIADTMAAVSSGILLLFAVMGKFVTCDLGECPEFRGTFKAAKLDCNFTFLLHCLAFCGT